MKEDSQFIMNLLLIERNYVEDFIDDYEILYALTAHRAARTRLARINAEIARRIPQTAYVFGHRFHGIVGKDIILGEGCSVI